VIEAAVDLVESLGAELMVHVTVPGAGGARAVARLSTRRRRWAGDVVKLGIDTSRLHLFDTDTGASLRARAAWALA
jgi:multiple sugar transport system ATP-binding protein